MSKPGARLAAIDIVRGYSIASMVLAHLAGSGVLVQITHPQPGFDGASGFVLLSGLVLGIVQHRRLRRDGLRAVQVRTLRRMGVLYVAQLSISLLAVVILQPGLLASPDSAGPIVLGIATMRIAPSAGDILRMYVIFLALALGAYWLLAHGRRVAVLCCSLLIYVVGVYLVPGYTRLTTDIDGPGGFSWAGWQLLFFSALLVGWHWESADLYGSLTRNTWSVLGITAMIAMGARVAYDWVPAWFDKDVFAPGRIVEAYAVVTFLVVAVDLLLRHVPRVLFRPLEMTGQRSLDAYVLQAGIGLIGVGGLGLQRTEFLALGTLLLCWSWAELRHRLSGGGGSSPSRREQPSRRRVRAARPPAQP